MSRSSNASITSTSIDMRSKERAARTTQCSSEPCCQLCVSLQRSDLKSFDPPRPLNKDIIMNCKTLVTVATAVIAIFGAVSAAADSQTATVQTRNNADIGHGDRGTRVEVTPSTLTRAQVAAEALVALRN